MHSIGFLELLVIFGVVGMLGMVLFGILPFWKIFSKAGYSGVLGLTMLIPCLNIIMLASFQRVQCQSRT